MIISGQLTCPLFNLFIQVSMKSGETQANLYIKKSSLSLSSSVTSSLLCHQVWLLFMWHQHFFNFIIKMKIKVLNTITSLNLFFFFHKALLGYFGGGYLSELEDIFAPKAKQKRFSLVEKIFLFYFWLALASSGKLCSTLQLVMGQ